MIKSRCSPSWAASVVFNRNSCSKIQHFAVSSSLACVVHIGQRMVLIKIKLTHSAIRVGEGRKLGAALTEPQRQENWRKSTITQCYLKTYYLQLYALFPKHGTKSCWYWRTILKENFSDKFTFTKQWIAIKTRFSSMKLCQTLLLYFLFK